jgi:hypothetical protein
VKKVPATKVVTTLQATESPLPPRIQEALGELVGAAREGLLALSVGYRTARQAIVRGHRGGLGEEGPHLVSSALGTG